MVTPSHLNPTPTVNDEPVYLQVTAYNGVAITKVPFGQVKTLFQRALNTWSDVPPELLSFSDSLEKL